MKRINMYIDHDRSVGSLFLEYTGVFCVKVKRDLGPTCLRLDVYIWRLSAFENFESVRRSTETSGEFIMSMLLRPEQPVERKSREAKNAKDLIRYISGLMSND